MKFNTIFFILILLTSCELNLENNISKKNPLLEKFSNSGFTLIYDNSLYTSKIINKKMNDRDLILFQKNLRKGTSVKVTNPYNDKTILAKVGENSKYPKFNNSVISKRIAIELEIDPKEPYIILKEVVDNNSFIAKKSKTYEAEKKVADKAPVETISINDLNETVQINEDKTKIDRKFNYSIKIADFYYLSTADLMASRIKTELVLNNVAVKKISENKYRVLIGPFSNIKPLQNAYNSVIKLNFENIEILKND